MTDFKIENGILIQYNGNDSHVVIPDGVTSIGSSAFFYCQGLTSVTIPSSVTSIGRYTFDGCTALTTISIPSSMTSIGDYAFHGCTCLTSINIPNSVTSIGESAFSGCTGLTSIEIPSSVTNIGSNAFYNCSGLTSIVVSSDNSIYDSRNNCNAIIVTKTNMLIVGCQNTVIPNSVTHIGTCAFLHCIGLININIPNSVKQIGSFAFYRCFNLKNIELTSRVTEIFGCAFSTLAPIKPQYNDNGALRAYKAFNADWTCRGFKYEIGKAYHQDGKIEGCKNGFHACLSPLDIFKYYYGDVNQLRFAEVELSGEMVSEGSKVAASDIKIVRELTLQDLVKIYNSMKKGVIPIKQ